MGLQVLSGAGSTRGLLQRSGFEPALNKCFDCGTGFSHVKYAEDKIRKAASKQENGLPLQSDLDCLVKQLQPKRMDANAGNCHKGPVSLHRIKKAYYYAWHSAVNGSLIAKH